MSLDNTSNTTTPTTVEAAAPAVKGPAPAPYTASDAEKLQSILRWLDERQVSRAALARKARIQNSTLSQVLNKRYPSSPTTFLDRAMSAIDTEEQRLSDVAPGYVEGSVHKLCWVVCERTRVSANFGVLTGNVGVGKTRALQEYRRRRPMTLLVEANPRMHPGSLLSEILAQLGATATGYRPTDVEAMFNSCLKALLYSSYLLVVDEAESVHPRSLHYLRRLRDKAHVGVVLAGTAKLTDMLRAEQGQFEQIRSRVSMWPPTIKALPRDDADDIAQRALAAMRYPDTDQAPEASDDVLDALWAYAGGSARVLTESLLPNLRDYGVLKKHRVNAALIDEIARKVLFMGKAVAA